MFLFTGSSGDAPEHPPRDGFIKIGPAAAFFYLLCSETKAPIAPRSKWGGGVLGQSTL